MELGLTLLESKVYLALVRLEDAPIKKIAMVTNITKQDIYRVIPGLQRKGIVEKRVTTPTTYKATPIEEATAILLHNKNQEYFDLQRKTAELVTNLKDKSKKTVDEETQFIIIAGRNKIIKTLININNNTYKTLNVAHIWDFTRNMLLKGGVDDIKELCERDVQVRWLTERHKEEPTVEKILQKLVQNPNFEIRYVRPPISLRAIISDCKKMSINATQGPNDVPCHLVSNNRMLAKAVTAYYEQIWHKASKVNRLRKGSDIMSIKPTIPSEQ